MERVINVSLLKCPEYGNQFVCETMDNAQSRYVTLGTGTATIKMLPEKDAVVAEIETLQAMKQRTLAEQALVIESIEDKIQSLLAIGHDGSES